MWENVSSAIVSLSGIEMQIFRSDLVWIYTTDESCGYASFLKTYSIYSKHSEIHSNGTN